MGKKKKDKSVKLSLPKEKELYGVQIIKLPVGRYVMALTSLERLPGVIADELIPDTGGIGELLEKLIIADRETIETVFMKLLTKVPQELCRFIAALLDIPAERLTDPQCSDALTVPQLLEIIISFWEINDMSDFFGNVRRLKELTARTLTVNTGFSGGLQ